MAGGLATGLATMTEVRDKGVVRHRQGSVSECQAGQAREDGRSGRFPPHWDRQWNNSLSHRTTEE